MYIIQYYDYDEGSAARWRDINTSTDEDKNMVQRILSAMRATDGEDCMYAYRIVEVGSKEYYSQPTDKLEY